MSWEGSRTHLDGVHAAPGDGGGKSCGTEWPVSSSGKQSWAAPGVALTAIGSEGPAESSACTCAE
jgi:hypothetical protein